MQPSPQQHRQRPPIMLQQVAPQQQRQQVPMMLEHASLRQQRQQPPVLQQRSSPQQLRQQHVLADSKSPDNSDSKLVNKKLAEPRATPKASDTTEALKDEDRGVKDSPQEMRVVDSLAVIDSKQSLRPADGIFDRYSCFGSGGPQKLHTHRSSVCIPSRSQVRNPRAAPDARCPTADCNTSSVYPCRNLGAEGLQPSEQDLPRQPTCDF